MARDFNPSNQPMTCLYCGTKLKHKVWKAYTYTSTITLCCQAEIGSGMERAPLGMAGWREVRRCKTCQREITGVDDTENVTRTTPEKVSARAGYDDIFCTLDCGYRFGKLAADKGVRYIKKED